MHYLIGRDLDGDGKYEFIENFENMVLTDEPNRALQFTKTQLNQIDMGYLNAAGFYALDADRFQVSLMESLLFAAPLVMGLRPLVAPPPRRRRMPPPPPPRPPRPPRPRAPRRVRTPSLGEMLVDALVGGPAPVPAPRPPRRPPAPRVRTTVRASAPRVYGPRPGGGTGTRSMGPGAGRAKGAGSLRKMGPGPGRGPMGPLR